MPNYYFREVTTPLKLVGIKLFKDDTGSLWVKFGSGRRKQLKRG
ncbi:hypothetical protein [Cohnella thailandensis]|nr:hypothetical protein [Cohnella thailandensis]MBP1975321.1 hypothetical protein [Cohnella thailandensis]